MAYQHRDLKQYIYTGGILLVLLSYFLIAVNTAVYYQSMNASDQRLWVVGCSIVAAGITVPVGLVHFQYFRSHYERVAAPFSILIISKLAVMPQLFDSTTVATAESYFCVLAVIIIVLGLRLQLKTIAIVLLASSLAVLLSLHVLRGLSNVDWASIFYYYFGASLICLKMAHFQNGFSRKVFEQEKVIQEKNQRLAELANRDSLTGLPNRRFFDDAIVAEWARHQRTGKSLAVLYVDVDHFKQFNDHYGHQHGDECLHKVGQAIHTALFRTSDLAARYGGEEFVVLLPDIDSAGAVEVAARILESIANMNIPHARSQSSDRVAACIGIGVMAPQRASDHKVLLEHADKALYQAKHSGRNQFVLYAEPNAASLGNSMTT